jgi:hypothetical protein
LSAWLGVDVVRNFGIIRIGGGLSLLLCGIGRRARRTDHDARFLGDDSACLAGGCGIGMALKGFKAGSACTQSRVGVRPIGPFVEQAFGPPGGR